LALSVSSNCLEDLMSELEMKNEAETEEFTDELSDEALDRERVLACCSCQYSCRAGN